MNDEHADAARWAELLDRPEISTPPGVTPAQLEAAEVELRTSIPVELRALYLRSDGVWHRDGQWYVIWPVDELVARNGGADTARAALAFGDDGTGNAFCVHADGGVSYWSEIDARHEWLAPNVESFWTGWVRDELPPR